MKVRCLYICDWIGVIGVVLLGFVVLVLDLIGDIFFGVLFRLDNFGRVCLSFFWVYRIFEGVL